jgi:guanylate kinase
MQVLERRLRGRATEAEEALRRRFDTAREEIAHYGLFDYVLVNDDLDDATERLISIFRAEECRRSRTALLAENLLAEGRGFGGSRPPGDD